MESKPSIFIFRIESKLFIDVEYGWWCAVPRIHGEFLPVNKITIFLLKYTVTSGNSLKGLTYYRGVNRCSLKCISSWV